MSRVNVSRSLRQAGTPLLTFVSSIFDLSAIPDDIKNGGS
jgi:hypothetical protein